MSRDMGGVSTEALNEEVSALGRWLESQPGEEFAARAQALGEYVSRSESTIKAAWASIRALDRGQIAFQGRLVDGVWVRDNTPFGTYEEAVKATV